MRSGNRQYLSSVDHLRAFAALLVVFYHGMQIFSTASTGIKFGVDPHWLYTNNPLIAVISEGHSAVALFMVLSGFIFTVGTLGHEISFRGFMTNRLLRIYPLFLLLIVVAGAADPGAFTFSGFLQLVGGLGNLPGAMQLGWASGMFWAVAVEVQFYLLFPLLNRLLTRWGLGAFARLMLAIIVVRTLVWLTSTTHDTLHMLYFNLAGRIDQFLLGMIIAWLYVHHRDRFRGWWKVGASTLIVIAAMWGFNHAHGFFSNSPWRLAWVDVEGGVWALLILTYVATLRADNVLTRLTAKVGELSYSIYVLHLLLMVLVTKNNWQVHIAGLGYRSNAFLTTLLVLLPLVLACSLATYHGVELQFLRLRVKYLLPAPQVAESGTFRDRPEAPAPAADSGVAPGSVPRPLSGYDSGRGQHSQHTTPPDDPDDLQPRTVAMLPARHSGHG